MSVGQRYLATDRIRVVCWRWWDTAAILEDYSDCAESEIGPGTRFEVIEIPPGNPSRVLAKLDRPNELKAQLLPKWYRWWWNRFLIGRCVDFRVEIAAAEIESKCSLISSRGDDRKCAVPGICGPATQCGQRQAKMAPVITP